MSNSTGKQIVHAQPLPGAGVANRRAQSAWRGRGQLLEKVGKRFFHAGRILYFNAGHFQSQNGETHGHPMVVVTLDGGAVELGRIHRERVALLGAAA